MNRRAFLKLLGPTMAFMFVELITKRSIPPCTITRFDTVLLAKNPMVAIEFGFVNEPAPDDLLAWKANVKFDGYDETVVAVGTTCNDDYSIKSTKLQIIDTARQMWNERFNNGVMQ